MEYPLPLLQNLFLEVSVYIKHGYLHSFILAWDFLHTLLNLSFAFPL